MAVEASGTQTATVTTEHTLSGAAITTSGWFTLEVDCAAMVGGDTLELRIYKTVLTAGTERLALMASYQHTQGEPVKLSIPWPSDISIKFTLKQTAGTGRAFPWKIYKATL